MKDSSLKMLGMSNYIAAWGRSDYLADKRMATSFLNNLEISSEDLFEIIERIVDYEIEHGLEPFDIGALIK